MPGTSLQRLSRWLLRLWGPFSRTRLGRFAEDIVRACRAVIQGFRGERLTLRAGYLTFVSIFSLAPLFTVSLALVQLTHQAGFQERLQQFIEALLAPGIRAESASFLRRFLNSANSRAAGGVGFAFLMMSGGMLLRHLDASLNEIWAVQRRRPVAISLLMYGLALTLGPLFVVLWLVGTSTVRALLIRMGSEAFAYPLGLGTPLVVVTMLTAIYRWVPHAPVRFRSALAGGLVAGLGWELARLGYARFASWGFKFNPIYGSLSAAPLFLTWIFLSWLLVLFGARLSYAVEHASFHGEFREQAAHPRTMELLGARIAQLTAHACLHHQPAPTPRRLARSLKVPEQRVVEVVRALTSATLLQQSSTGGLLPSQPPHTLTLADVSQATGAVLFDSERSDKHSEFKDILVHFAAADAQNLGALAKVSWADLAAALPEPTATVAVAS